MRPHLPWFNPQIARIPVRGPVHLQVCPPALLARSNARAERPKTLSARLALGLESLALAVGRLLGVAPPPPQRPRLADVRTEFEQVLTDLGAAPDSPVMADVRAARSLRELWHLRVGVYTLACQHMGQAAADHHLASLDRHFPTRAMGAGALKH